MSKENLRKLMKKAATDESLGQQLQDAESYEDIKKLARAAGLDLGTLTEAEARVVVEEASMIEDIDDELFEFPPALL